MLRLYAVGQLCEGEAFAKIIQSSPEPRRQMLRPYAWIGE